MSNPTTTMTDALYQYMLAHGNKEAPILAALRRETMKLPNGYWAATPEQASFLQMLVRLLQAKRIFEIGTYTGYATMAMAMAQPSDGRVITCDVALGWSEMGVHYWRDAGVEPRIERRLGRADEVMTEILAGDGPETFDLIYLDANKRNYCKLFDLAAQMLHPGGLMVIDDVFWKGRVAKPADDDPQLTGILEFNEKLLADDRFDIAMLPITDGMTLARKK